MKFIVRDIKAKVKAESLVLTYFTKDKPISQLFWKWLKQSEKKQVARLFKQHEFSGKEGEVKVLLRAGKGKLMLLGLGNKSKWNLRKAVLAARHMVAVAKAEKIKQLTVPMEALAVLDLSSERLGQLIAENALMADYEFLHYKQKPDNGFFVKELVLAVEKEKIEPVSAGVRLGQIIGEQINLARDLGNIPGGEMTPQLLANKAVEFGKKFGFKVKVLGLSEIKKAKMGAILGVANGSAEDPKFIVMEYYGGQKNEAPYVLVGKGVTFDTGGLNLKPEKGMSDMHLDMSGGAAVMAALGAISQLKLLVNVVVLVPAVENMPGSAGYRPGDLLKSLSGKTIEVLNTDAEGRIILADALTYAERFKPKLVVDVATLTGACPVALGLQIAGLLTPDKELQDKLHKVGDISGDYVWPLPMWEEYEEEIKGTFGDVQNIGKSGYAGAITAAMFLWQFAKKYKWAHLDIAGPMKTIDGQYLAKGASGVGVRFLVELVRTNPV